MLTSTVAILNDNAAHGEDSFLVRSLHDRATLDAVMDGVTGRGGREASQEVVHALSDAPLASPEAIVALLEDINQRFYQISLGRFLLTTASVALCLGHQLHVVSVGDSQVWLIRPDTVQLLSSDARGFVHVGIARALGMQKTLRQLHRADVEIVPGDRLVLTTDGVTDNMTQDELVDMVRRAVSPDEAVEQIRMLMSSRRAKGVLPAQLGGRFRNDDQTAILRFFSAAT
jgi:serine/threonine protein phosphatase PrpC